MKNVTLSTIVFNELLSYDSDYSLEIKKEIEQLKVTAPFKWTVERQIKVKCLKTLPNEIGDMTLKFVAELSDAQFTEYALRF
jgi:hypothetical protein